MKPVLMSRPTSESEI